MSKRKKPKIKKRLKLQKTILKLLIKLFKQTKPPTASPKYWNKQF